MTGLLLHICSGKTKATIFEKCKKTRLDSPAAGFVNFQLTFDNLMIKPTVMFIRMLNFQIQENKKGDAVMIMDSMIPKIRSLRGCKDCMFIVHETDDHYALLVFWDSKENANAAAGLIGPQLLPALNKISKENVFPRLYEVYQPASVLQEQW
jgi:hypothetical protein